MSENGVAWARRLESACIMRGENVMTREHPCIACGAKTDKQDLASEVLELLQSR
jgi:hypothetical protein